MSDETTDNDLVVVDLGKHKRKKVKKLRRGEGRLMERVQEAVEELRAAGAIDANAVPVVFVVRQKARGIKRLF